MRRSRALLARLIPVAMLASILAVVGGGPANADPIPATNWTPITVADLPGATKAETDASGGVTVGCPITNQGTSFKSFDVDGGAIQNRPIQNPRALFCVSDSVVGKDGTVYVTAATQTAPVQYYIQAWKSDSLVWQYTIPCGADGWSDSMAMGADDNMYMVVQGGSCGYRLIGLSPTAQSGTNPPSPQVVMNQALSVGNVPSLGLAAYNDGLVLYTSGGIKYVAYSGSSSSPVAVANMLQSYYLQSTENWFTATTSGRVFVPTRANAGASLGCSDTNNVVGGITAVDPSAQNDVAWTISTSACLYVHELHPLPNNGFVMRYGYVTPGSSASPAEKITAFDGNGQAMWTQTVQDVSQVGSYAMSADLSGNVVLRADVALWHTVNGSSYRFPEIDLTLFSGLGGSILRQVNLRGENDTTSGPSYKSGNAGELSMAKNTFYVTAQQCTNLSYCDGSSTKLYAFTVPGLAMDYPRGAILKHDEPWKDYVALGDSFSSGEGVEPFISGTNTSGTNPNLCHRSEGAYPKLLSGNPGTRLNLTGFRACSGAKTEQITGVWPNAGSNSPNLGEHAQDEALSSTTGLVTVSIGGNDVKFSDFVLQCLFLDCSATSVQQYFATQVDNLGSELDSAYSDILTKAPNATVYVVGYPQILPDPSTCSNPLGAGVAAFNDLVGLAKAGDSGATATVTAIGQLVGVPSTLINDLINAGQVTFTADEMTAGRAFTAALNNKIAGMVSIENSPRLKFVSATASGSPFAGHELCTSNPYFNGLDVVNKSYSFHPNQLGQDAYRQLVQSQF